MRDLVAGPVAGGLGRHEDALGAAGGHVADGIVIAEEVGGHGDDLGLESLEALEGGGAEAVGVEVGLERLTEDFGDVIAGVVDEGPELAALPVDVLGGFLLELLVDLVAGESSGRQFHGDLLLRRYSS